jgi:D-beta-D-heptose 7-phosphate kinase/D-beta-D-heptose 1-phosphate adenosyltransferase
VAVTPASGADGACSPDPIEVVGLIARSAPRVLVVGDAVLDGWVSGPTHRTARDGAMPVIELVDARTAPGGAAGTAAALAALGAQVELITAMGDDHDGRVLRRELTALGVRSDRCVLDPARPTAAKRRVLAGNPPEHPVARFDVTPPPMGAALSRALADQVSVAVAEGAALLVADYGLGTLTDAVRRRLARARARIPMFVLDAHDLLSWAALRPDTVTPSVAEAAALLGEAVPSRDRVAWAVARHGRLVEASGGAEVLVTVDVDGVVRLPADGSAPQRMPAATAAPATHCNGAGDVFAAAWTAARCVGAAQATALAVAQAAADVVVQRPGAAACGTSALTAQLASADPGRVLSHSELLAVLAEHRAAGHRVVFTNGCFDVLHRGHVGYLREARALGDLLVVALNSDASVSRLKGPTRPVNPLEDRAGVVGALGAVDIVTAFEADSPVELLELVRPDVYAKGGDYTPEMLPETPVVEALGGAVHILGYLADHSTSAVVARAQLSAQPGRAAVS